MASLSTTTFLKYLMGLDFIATIKSRTLVLALVVAAAAYGYWVWKKQKQEEVEFSVRHSCQPVQAKIPYKWPFAIDVLKAQYDALPSGRLLEFQTKYLAIAPTIQIDILGKGYIITDPVNIKAITTTSFEDYVMGSRRLGLLPLLGEGIFTQDGAAWKHSRELQLVTVRRQFVRVNEGGLTAFDSHINDLLDSVTSEAEASITGVVDLQPHFFEYTLGTTTDLLFGEPHSSLPKDDRESLRDNFDYASLISAIRLRLADLAWIYTPFKFKMACIKVRDWASFFADKALSYMEKHGERAASEKYGFIVDLWKDTQDRRLVRDQLLHVLIAGRDTTACLLSWTFFHLVRNPRLIQRLKDDISAVIPVHGQGITRHQIQQLPFLRCCINETLRLYPQLPVNVRFAARNTVLPRGGGPDGQAPVFIGKGCGVGWSTYHMHRSEATYGPDARSYRPERWEDGELYKKQLGSGFLDFHGGPRLCLGKDYAITEASLAIIRILQEFPGIRLPPAESNGPVGSERQNLTIVLSSGEGVRVLLK